MDLASQSPCQVWQGLTNDRDRITFADASGMNDVAQDLQVAHVDNHMPIEALLVAEGAKSRAFELLLAQQRLLHSPDAERAAVAEQSQSAAWQANTEQ